MRVAAWWVLGAVFVLAPLGDEVFKLRATVVAERPQEDLDPAVRFLGAVQSRYEAAADAVPAGREFRDVEFFLDDPAAVSVIATTGGGSLELVFFNRQNEPAVTATVVPGQETRIEVQGEYGSKNRLRLRRLTGDIAQPLPFQLQVRRLP